MRRSAFTLSVALLFTASSSLAAQAAPAAAPTGAVPAAAPVAVTPGARRAAEELLGLMNTAAVLRSGSEASFDAQIKAQPLMAPFRATMQAWADKYLTWEALGPQLVQVYAEEFTEGELRQMIAFYRTPAGRKLASRLPTLTQRGAQIGAEGAQAHVPELQQMIQARAAELQKSGALPGSGTPPSER